MRCIACNVDNPDGFTVCRSCGSPLETGAPEGRSRCLPPGQCSKEDLTLSRGYLVREGSASLTRAGMHD